MNMMKMTVTLGALILLGWSGMTFASSCSINCPSPSASIGCSISASPGNTVMCFYGGYSDITCCEVDSFGAPVRDIHLDCPGMPGGGGGSCGAPCNPGNFDLP